MSRPLRIEYPGAWYHVMNRGRRFENIFSDDADYEMFVELLKDTSEMWNVNIAAYCLMSNHYHILLQTPDGNISRTMRHINGVYTQRFNRKYSHDGQLFRGRYKSILVGGDSYLLQLVRYIHRNPIKAGLVTTLDSYKWSSHKGYLSIAQKWSWLHKTFIFSLLTKNKEEWIKIYRQFVSVEKDDNIYQVIEAKKWPSILGPKNFLDWVKGKYYKSKKDEDIPESKLLDPSQKLILEVVCKYYAVDEKDIYKSRRGSYNEPRNVLIYLIRRLRQDNMKQIGKEFNIEKSTSVSSIVERVKKQLQSDKTLKKRIDELINMVNKSQKRT
ncbi:MAG: transposase [Proteobacteria bacterium]|nr:transposase [Pseudomonadota bacterium]